MSRIRFGLVGSGYWARTVHGPGLRMRDDVELVGVWGRDAGRTEESARALGVRGFDRPEAMFAAVDAVAFAVPPEVQARHALAAAVAGKHLLLEKPIAIAPADAARLVDAVAQRGLASVVFFTRRYVPEIEAAIEAASRERWNEAKVRVLSGSMLPGSPFAESVWRQAEGAALWDIGPHVLSVLVPVLGAVMRTRASIAPGSVVNLATEHAGGATAAVSVSLHAVVPATISEFEFRAGGRSISMPNPDFPRPEALSRAAGELVAAIRSGRPAHRCDVAFGRDVTFALAAAARSVASGAFETVGEPG